MMISLIDLISNSNIVNHKMNKNNNNVNKTCSFWFLLQVLELLKKLSYELVRVFSHDALV